MKHKYIFSKRWSALAIAIAAGTSLGGITQPLLAQSAVSPSGNGRFFVELKDATLEDAVNMVLKAAGNPGNYTVDPSAREVRIGSVTFTNAAWDSIIRSLANQNGFTVRLVSDGSKSVEPRAPVFNEGFGGGGYPGGGGGYPSGGGGYPGGGGGYGGSSSGGYGGSSSSGYPGAGRARGGGGYPAAGAGLPSNPFGDPRSQAALRTRRSVVTTQQFADPQTAPSLGAGAGNDEGKDYHLVPVRHVYVGGIAKLFENSEIIGTEDFLIPDGAFNSGGGGGGGFGGQGGGGGFGGGGGGFGGGGGGFGGGGGGFGGGGFGGGGGGFGGGGFGGGGLGGGGFGGGGLGGGGFGGFGG